MVDFETILKADLKATAVHVIDGVANEVSDEAGFDEEAAFDIKADFDVEADFGVEADLGFFA